MNDWINVTLSVWFTAIYSLLVAWAWDDQHAYGFERDWNRRYRAGRRCNKSKGKTRRKGVSANAFRGLKRPD